MAKFKYLGRTSTNQNWIHKEIKGRLNSWKLATISEFVFPSPF
jgi:hypothetical protein